MKEMQEQRLSRQRHPGRVFLVQRERREHGGLRSALPHSDVSARDAGKFRVELYAFDAQKGILRGKEHGAAFACTYIEEDCALDGRERMQLTQPEIEQR